MVRNRNVVRAIADTLEARRLLADSITIFRNSAGVMIINRNGIEVPMADNIVNGSSGNDTIRVESTGANSIIINPGSGADTVIVASDGDLDDLGAGGVQINSGTDAVNDAIEIRDYLDGGNDSYEFSQLVVGGDTKLIKPDLPGNESEFVQWKPTRFAVTLKTNSGSSTVTLPNTLTLDATGESIVIDDSQGNGGSVVEFRSRLEDPAAFAVVGGTGADTLDFRQFAVNYGAIEFSFDAGSGSDTLIVEGNANTVDVFSGSASFDDGADIVDFDWTNLENLQLVARGGTSFVVAGNVGTEPATTLVGDSGVDTFQIGAGSISGVNSPITIDGNNGLDTVTLNDSTSNVGKAMNLNSGVFGYTGGNPVNLSEVEYVTINAGSGNDSVTLGADLDDLIRVVVNAGSGNDSVNVTPSAASEIELYGSLPIVSPGDTLSITRGGATNGRIVPSGIGEEVLFDDRDTIYFEGFETEPTTPAAPGVTDLSPADDSGQSSSDNHTNLTSLRFGGNVGVANAAVRLFRSGIEIGSGLSDSFGDYQVVGTFPAGDATAPVTVTYQAATATIRSLPSAALNVRVDTIAPTAPTAAPDLVDASDTGISFSDNATFDNTPTINALSSERVRLLSGATVLADYAASGNSTLAPLADGNYTLTSRSVDVAGNQSAASPSMLLAIDTVAPPAPAAPDLLDVFDSGPFNNDNVTNDSQPSFSVVTTGSAPYVRLFVDGALASGSYEEKISAQVGVSMSDGVRLITARAIDTSGNVSAVSGPALTLTLDTRQPSLTTPATFVYNAEFTQPHAITYLFDEDVSASLVPADWTVTNTTTSTTFAPTVAYNASLNRAILRFPATTTLGIAGMLPDGNYTSFFNRTNITDLAGNSMDSNSNRSFFVMMGDANHDRSVNFDDLLLLAQNYGTNGKTYSAGNFNYSTDGAVTFDDLLLLAQRYGTTLSVIATPTTPSKRRPGAIAELVDAPTQA